MRIDHKVHELACTGDLDTGMPGAGTSELAHHSVCDVSSDQTVKATWRTVNPLIRCTSAHW